MRRRQPEPEFPFREMGDPLYSQRNPHQIFLLTFSIFSAVGLVEGSTASPTLSDALGQYVETFWAVCLFGGSAVGLLGMWWQRTWTGLVIERAGLALVSGAAMIYSVLVFATIEDNSYTAWIHMAYGLSCGWRVGQIFRRLRWVRRMVARANKEMT